MERLVASRVAAEQHFPPASSTSVRLTFRRRLDTAFDLQRAQR